MTPEMMKNWLQGVIDFKTAEGTPMTAQDLVLIRNTINNVLAMNENTNEQPSTVAELPINPRMRGIMSC